MFSIPNATDLLKNSNITRKFDEIIRPYSFILVSDHFEINQNIIQNLIKSQIIIIDQYIENTGTQYFIISFEQTLIMIKKSSLQILQDFFNFNQNLTICFFKDIKNDFDQKITIKYHVLKTDQNQILEIKNFNKLFTDKCSKKALNYEILSIFKSCISGYLIKSGYLLKRKNRIENFLTNQEKNYNFDADDYVVLRQIGIGSEFIVELIYHFETKELFALKRPNINNLEIAKLVEREQNNYSILKNPFIPKFVGITKKEKYLVIEYIDGNILKKENFRFNDNVKYTMIFQLMLVIEFLHQHHYIYRDLKNNNVIIDQNGTIVLIDFDRMVKYDDDSPHTNDLSSPFLAPEVNSGNFSYPADIFSLGKMIEYIINHNCNEIKNYEIIQKICNECTKQNPNERPTISDLILDFCINFQSKIQINGLVQFYESFCNNSIYDNRFILTIKNIFMNINDEETQFCIAEIYENGQYNVQIDMEKAIHFYELAAAQNHSESLFLLGLKYFSGKYVIKNIRKATDYFLRAANQNHTKASAKIGTIYLSGILGSIDVKKAIYYLSIAAKANIPYALHVLGTIYEDEIYGVQDIKKAIHYYELGSKYNYAESQYSLGTFYYEGEYIEPDVNKAIHYYKLAASQNHSESQFALGLIYYEEQDIEKAIYYYGLAADQNHLSALNNLGIIYEEKDIKKAIHYYEIAANENDPDAQFNLAVIYDQGRFVEKDIKKAIHYYELAADQNHSKALFNLALIYENEEGEKKNINKIIKYYSLAADQDNAKAQFNLGTFYEEGKYVKKDIKKAIYLFSLAAEHNILEAQMNLAKIYENGYLVTRDIKKAIYYYTLAANQNDPQAQYCLGLFYEKGNYVEKNIVKAIQYYSLASEQNNPDAHFKIGLMYINEQYVNKDIKKALNYLLLAAKQNHSRALFTLGVIYYDGKFVERDINKSVHYYMLAAKQNNAYAQFNLGLIYLEGKFVQRNIEKSIYYFTIAAKLNLVEAQCFLGNIFYDGKYVPRDINKAIYYYMLASDQNYAEAQCSLGFIYYENKYIKRDLSKMFHYFTLSANNNYSKALCNLGIIFFEGYYVKQNINKSIHYFSLASSQNNSFANRTLGIFYYEGKFVPRNVDKAIHYLIRASKLNDSIAQYAIASIYFDFYHDVDKSLLYLIESSKNGYNISNFYIGYFYHTGQFINKNISKAIHFYKIASSFNIQYAKVNLGIIYKNGIENEVDKNISYAIALFEEAIHQKNDIIAMFNLAQIYFYEKEITVDDNKIIDLLIKSSVGGFIQSFGFLCLVLVKIFDFNLENIKNELNNNENISVEFNEHICKTILKKNLINPSVFSETFSIYKSIDFSYTNEKIPIKTSKLLNLKHIEIKKNLDLTSDFYEGFGNGML